MVNNRDYLPTTSSLRLARSYLVRLDGGNLLVEGDKVTNGLVELAQRALVNRLGHRRHLDHDGVVAQRDSAGGGQETAEAYSGPDGGGAARPQRGGP